MSSSNNSSSSRRNPRENFRSRSRSNNYSYHSDSRNSRNNSNNNRRNSNSRSSKSGHFSSAATSGYGTKAFIFGKQDKGKWARFLTNLNAEFASEKISYLNNFAEVLRRKTNPAPPINLPIPPFLETDAEREFRVREQKRLDDLHKSLSESHRVYSDKTTQPQSASCFSTSQPPLEPT